MNVMSVLVAAMMLGQGAGKAQVLTQVADVPLPGAAVRFDYQSLDEQHGRLYIAHMNANQLVVFDTATRKVVANLDDFKRVRGVLVVPEKNRVYTSNTGDHLLAVLDAQTLQVVAKAGPISSPDGIGYDPVEDKVFVSDQRGGTDTVVDAKTNRVVTRIAMGGEVGNTVYDAPGRRVLAAVGGANELVVIDPAADTVTARYKLPGIDGAHGIVLDDADRLAFVAGEENHSLALFDLRAMKLLATYQVGDDPDVLAFDAGLKRLYVSAESGDVTVFQLEAGRLKLLGRLHMPHAHTVSVDQKTHLVYFPLEEVAGTPLLRIMRPADLKERAR